MSGGGGGGIDSRGGGRRTFHFSREEYFISDAV